MNRLLAVGLRGLQEGAHIAPFAHWAQQCVLALPTLQVNHLTPGLMQLVALYCALRCIRSCTPCKYRRKVHSKVRGSVLMWAKRLGLEQVQWLPKFLLSSQKSCGDSSGVSTQNHFSLALLLVADVVAGILMYPLLAWLWSVGVALVQVSGLPTPDLHTVLAVGVLQELLHSWRHDGASFIHSTP